jgi:hypothetical protein
MRLLATVYPFLFVWISSSVKGLLLLLPKVSLGPAMPYPSMPCRRATSEIALWPFQDSPAHMVGKLWPSTTPLDTPQCTPMLKTTAAGSVIKN